ncbi:DinB family protein [Chloroflexota bacterium]
MDMSTEEKKHLIDQLTEVHKSIRSVLDGVDPEMPVHKDNGWRVRDIVGHMATWDQEIANSLQAYQAGSEYLTPNLDEAEVGFNEKAVLDQKDLTNQQIIDIFVKASQEFIKAIKEIQDERFPGELLYPWGNERGDIKTLVNYMIEHDIEHRDEILDAIKASQEK